MAQINGQLIICDRCGETVFVKCAGEGEADGGYTLWNKFEAPPEGWDYHSEVGRLCPRCNQEYLRLLAMFKNRNKEAEG